MFKKGDKIILAGADRPHNRRIKGTVIEYLRDRDSVKFLCTDSGGGEEYAGDVCIWEAYKCVLVGGNFREWARTKGK